MLGAMVVGVTDYCYVTPEIIKIFLPKEYWDGIYIMAPILYGYFFSFIFSIYVNIEYFNKKTTIIAIGTIIAAVVNIVSNYYLIPMCGYEISAYTTLLSYFVLFIYHFIYNLKYNYFNVFQMWVTIVVLAVLLVLFQLIIDVIIVRYIVLLSMNLLLLLGGYKYAKHKKYPIDLFLKNLRIKNKDTKVASLIMLIFLTSF